MTSGRDALHEIDAAIAAARGGLAKSSDAAAGDARAVAELDQRQIGIYQSLADLRLVHLRDDDGVGGALGTIDSKAELLMSRHDGALAELAAARDSAAQALDRLEQARVEAEGAVDAAIAAHDAAAAQTRARLEQDPKWRAKADALEELNAMAARAAQKFEVARDDRTQKGAAYEADPLFQYLRERKFATRDYRAFPLFAMLDGWVAKLIRYREHRLNYERLLEIPERLAEHAERLQTEAARTASAAEVFERQALEEDGVGKLRDAVATARARVEALDAEIAAAEVGHAKAGDAFAAAAAGKTGPLAEARDLVAAALQKAALPDLKVLAAETATSEDDRLIDALITVRRQRMEIEEARRAAAASLDRQARTLSDLEGVRRRFKTARFDSPYSEFTGRDVIAILVSEFLRGALPRDDFWRRLERSHKTRQRDWDNDFGGDPWRDGFGLPDSWGGGNKGGQSRGGPVIRPPSGARPPRMPRIPSMPSRGGFRTTRRF